MLPYIGKCTRINKTFKVEVTETEQEILSENFHEINYDLGEVIRLEHPEMMKVDVHHRTSAECGGSGRDLPLFRDHSGPGSMRSERTDAMLLLSAGLTARFLPDIWFPNVAWNWKRLIFMHRRMQASVQKEKSYMDLAKLV